MPTLNQLRRALFLTNRTLGDVQAVRRGRIAERVVNRAMGRASSAAMRRLWR